MTRARVCWSIGLAAVIGVALTHHQVLGLEFRADDYAILRSWTGAEVREAITGSWSGTRAFQDPYHRPIAGLYHAAIARLFGLNGPGLHLVSLVELTAVVWMLACMLWRETARPLAVLAAAVYLINPLLRDSTSAWIFNQFHLLAVLIVASAVLIWQRRRKDPDPRAWAPIFALAAVGWYVKEDTVMLLPGLLLAQNLRARLLADVPAPSRRLWLGAAGLFATLLAIRLVLLPPFATLATREPLLMREVAMSLSYALGRPFFARVHQHVAPLGTALLVTLLVGAVATLRTRHATALGLASLGAALLGCAALPLMFQPGLGTTRVHFVVFASAIIGAGGLVQIGDWIAAARSQALRVAAAALFIAGLWSLHGAALGAQDDLYAPCSPVQLESDAEAATWPIVPETTRRWLIDKAPQCREHGHVRPIRDRPATGR